ncbi:hypothetical protein C943_00412 [Mariniradius saccharolyticus AK6]|uniref:Alpha/beta hydrolase n=1 Tax=Mariniradius saccharolyticus AK6 TaxID=1239962 RepID=M7X6R6_9BACT|nr:hypothetical protein [Mariniradius saccharolyticus]EMS33135.1 hypothetical protein C943_00412 [Mariniradius saccharolyticus AK6]
MKNLFLYFLAFFSISFLISCTTTRTIPTVEGSYDGIEVYTVKNPGKEFNEIKFIQVHGGWFSGPNGLTKKLIKRAKAEGADALVNVQYNQLHVGATISGTAIKFDDPVN